MPKPDSQMLNIAEEIPRTQAEGPGYRYAIWVQGCPIRCPGCCNPHMLDFVPRLQASVDELAARVLATPDIEGVTFLGGEPLSQAASLARLAERLTDAGLSVMIFTGYTHKHITARRDPHWNALLDHCDLLVAGPYQRAQHTANKRWIGSRNQQVYFLSERYRNLQDNPGGWDDGPNTVEIRFSGGRLTVNGFPDPRLESWLKKVHSR